MSQKVKKFGKPTNDPELRAFFLKEFMRHLLLSNYQKVMEEARLEKRIYSVLKKEKEIVLTPRPISGRIVPTRVVQNQQNRMPMRQQQQVRRIVPTQRGLPVPRPGGKPPIEFVSPRNEQNTGQNGTPAVKPNESEQYETSIITPLTNLGLGRILPILQDRSVQSLECPGPGKPLIINKGGMIQTSPINLSAEEIDNIMKDVSEKTRIPLISGAFKAAFDRYVMTAVVSDYVGTRFVVQRKLSPTQFE